MCEEYNSVLSTPTESDQFDHFGWYQYIGETQISAWYISQADVSIYLYLVSQLSLNVFVSWELSIS